MMRRSGVCRAGRAGAGRTARLRPVGAVLAVVALTGACSDAPGAAAGAPGGDVASAAGAAGASPQSAKAALDASAKQVKAQVDQLAAPLQVGGQRQVTVDDAGPCELDSTAPWPRRWGYAVMLTLPTTKPVDSAKALRDRLAAQGWEIRPHDTTSDSIDVDARKAGLVLRVSGDPNPATVTIEGYGVCVGADGRPVR